MSPGPRFLRLGAVAAALTFPTTLAIHLLPQLWADSLSFEARLDLRTNAVYMARLFVVLLHCLLVVISMAAARSLAPSGAAAAAGLGFLAFLGFAYTETLRTSLALFALNRSWRAAYAAAADTAARERARALIEGFSGINDALFFVFIACFLLGTLCYGVAFRRAGGLTSVIGWLFLAWTALSAPGLIDAATGAETLSGYFDWVGPYFQAPARGLIAVWLWRAGSAALRAPRAAEQR
jgi:hypothetical protein